MNPIGHSVNATPASGPSGSQGHGQGAVVRTSTHNFKSIILEFMTIFHMVYANDPAKLAVESKDIPFFEAFMGWYKHYSGRSYGFLDPKLSYVMMRFSEMDIVDVFPNLIQNSANCKFTYMNAVINAGSIGDLGRPLFVKLVPVSSRVDNPVIDNVNAQLLATLTKGSPIAKHIMSYFDSFLTYHPMSRSQWSIPDDDNMTHWPQRAQPSYARASLMDTIFGQPLSRAREHMLTDLIFAFQSFFMNTIVPLGVSYGIVHNDLHLGNLFFEPTTKTIKMIDYGRMYIGAAAQRPDVVPIIQYELFKYAMPHASITSYEQLIDEHGSRGLYNPDGSSKVCIMDAITLCANMYRLFSMSPRPLMRIFDDLITFKSNADIKIAGADNVALLQLYCVTDDAHKKHPSSEFRRFVKIMNEGLLLLALLVNSRAPESPKDFLHSSFQFKKDRAEFDKYIAALDKLFGDLQMTDQLLYDDFMGRTVLLSKMTWRANMMAGGALAMRSAQRFRPVARNASRTLMSVLPKLATSAQAKPFFDPVKEFGPRSALTPQSKKPTHEEIMASLEAFANKNVGEGGERLDW